MHGWQWKGAVLGGKAWLSAINSTQLDRKKQTPVPAVQLRGGGEGRGMHTGGGSRDVTFGSN